jgi:hypothetical protein
MDELRKARAEYARNEGKQEAVVMEAKAVLNINEQACKAAYFEFYVKHGDFGHPAACTYGPMDYKGSEVKGPSSIAWWQKVKPQLHLDRHLPRHVVYYDKTDSMDTGPDRYYIQLRPESLFH